MSLEDKTLTCRECGADFIFTAGEQEFYQSKGLQNAPSRCLPCRQLAKSARNAANGGNYGGFSSGGGGRPPRQMHETTCADCGTTTQVPFIPKYDRPVYCSNCFENHRVAR